VLLQQSLVTVQRVLIGSFVGALVGMVLGLAIGLNNITRRMFYPALNLVRQIPLLALSLLFLIWFGGDEVGIYVYVIFGVATMIMVNTINAVRNVPPVQVQYARTLGAGPVRIVRTIIIPAIIPELSGGIVVAVGLAWAMVLAAEYLGTQQGLGRMMLFFEYFGYTGRMVVVLGAFVIGALLVYLAVTAGARRINRWMPD
jgi:ABC-type nitrate/sulfonate/bicarbonate transport system permease component